MVKTYACLGFNGVFRLGLYITKQLSQSYQIE